MYVTLHQKQRKVHRSHRSLKQVQLVDMTFEWTWLILTEIVGPWSSLLGHDGSLYRSPDSKEPGTRMTWIVIWQRSRNPSFGTFELWPGDAVEYQHRTVSPHCSSILHSLVPSRKESLHHPGILPEEKSFPGSFVDHTDLPVVSSSS